MTTDTDDVSVVNKSLGLFGGGSIQSFDETSPLAVICSSVYETTISSLFCMHPWRFAMAKRQLAKSSEEVPLNEWKYAFVLPSSMLAGPWAVFGDGRQMASHAFEIYGQFLYCDYDTVVIDYTKRVAESYWPAWFERLAVMAAAADLAVPVSDQVSKSENFRKIAFGNPEMQGRGGLFAECRRLDGQTQAMRSLFSNGDPLTTARFAGVTPAIEGEVS